MMLRAKVYGEISVKDLVEGKILKVLAFLERL